jgi:hypothetical protein
MRLALAHDASDDDRDASSSLGSCRVAMTDDSRVTAVNETKEEEMEEESWRGRDRLALRDPNPV